MSHDDDLQLRWMIAYVRDLASRNPQVTHLEAASHHLVAALGESRAWVAEVQQLKETARYKSWLRHGLAGLGWITRGI